MPLSTYFPMKALLYISTCPLTVRGNGDGPNMNVQYIKMLGRCHCCHRRSLTRNYNSIQILAAGNHTFMQDNDWLLQGNSRYKGNGKREIKVKLILVNRA